jgi:hypothetical protein
MKPSNLSRKQAKTRRDICAILLVVVMFMAFFAAIQMHFENPGLRRIVLFGSQIVIWGLSIATCYYFAKYRGLSPWYMLLGLIPMVGLFYLAYMYNSDQKDLIKG